MFWESWESLPRPHIRLFVVRYWTDGRVVRVKWLSFINNSANSVPKVVWIEWCVFLLYDVRGTQWNGECLTKLWTKLLKRDVLSLCPRSRCARRWGALPDGTGRATRVNPLSREQITFFYSWKNTCHRWNFWALFYPIVLLELWSK